MKALLTLALVSATAFANGPEYPAPARGYKKIVVPASPVGSASVFSLALSQKATGPCFNGSTFMAASMEAKNLEGWGYTYYVLSEVTGPHTYGRAACRAVTTPTPVGIRVNYLERNGSTDEKFFGAITIETVFYVPENVDVRLVRWNAERPVAL